MDNSSITVVKLGGTQGVDFAAICQDAADLIAQGQQFVFVHGGSAEANALGESLGQPPRFITSPSGYSSRYTDRQTLEIFLMAVNGKVNSLLVEQLQALGVNSLGLSGLDGRLMLATRKEAIQSIENGKRKVIRDDYTGKIEQVNRALLLALLQGGYLPVIAPLAVSRQGEALNVDADRAAAMLAAALEADTLLLLTAVPGLMRSFPDESTLIHNLPAGQLAASPGIRPGTDEEKSAGRGRGAARRGAAGDHRRRAGRKTHLSRFSRKGHGDPMSSENLFSSRRPAHFRPVSQAADPDRARLGGAAVGQRRAGIPGLHLRAWGGQPGARPSQGGGSHRRPGDPAGDAVRDLLQRPAGGADGKPDGADARAGAGILLQFGHRVDRGGHQVRPAVDRAQRDHRRHARLPRAHAGGALGHLEQEIQPAFRAAGAALQPRTV